MGQFCFSVISAEGQSIATTPYIIVGNRGCTNSFLPGTYIIRFNGATVRHIMTLI